MRRPLDRESGVVLIVTLWIILGLTATAIFFAHSVRMQQWREANVSAGRQSEAAVEAACAYVSTVLAVTEKGRIPVPQEQVLCNAVAVGAAKFWLLGRADADAADSQPVFALADEAAKLNLNTATEDMLLGLPGMTAAIAAAIVDWRDPDDEPNPDGAESESYSRLERPYQAKNAPFSSPEELRLVYGVELSLLTGRDANLNGVVEDGEASPAISLLGLTSTPSLDLGWLSYVTVWSREPMTQTDGSPRIDVNDRNTANLGELLRTQLGADTATAVLSAVNPRTSQFRSILEFYLSSGLDAQQFSLIDDAMTATDRAEISGLINVNTASAVVLACVPGIDEASAAQLVSYRGSHPDELDSVAWVAEVLTRDAAIEAGPHLTTRSYQIAADIVAMGEGNRGYRRTWTLFDTSGESVTILYQRDLTALGWALGTAAREELSE